MDLCDDINFKQEEIDCDIAFNGMDSGNYLFGSYIFLQESKECMNQDNSIREYIHCYAIEIDYPVA